MIGLGTKQVDQAFLLEVKGSLTLFAIPGQKADGLRRKECHGIMGRNPKNNQERKNGND